MSVARALLACLLLALALGAPASARADFGFLPGAAGFSAEALQGDGSVADLAGSHPYALTTRIALVPAGESPGQPGVPFSDGDLRDLSLRLPAGLIENPAALPRCSQDDFRTPRSSPYEASLSGESCPASTQVGVVTVGTEAEGGSPRRFGVFNLVPPPGAPSQLGFSPYGAPVALTPRVRDEGGEYGLTLSLRNFPQQIDVHSLELTIWGTPWAASHNGERGDCLNEAEPGFPFAKCSVGSPKAMPPRAYLTLPASCDGPLAFRAEATSWQQPATVAAVSATPGPLRDCDGVPFEPSPRARLDTARAGSPTGFDFTLDGNGLGLLDPNRRAGSQVQRAVLRLPEGMTINPSVGAGLGVCSAAQYAAETATSPPGAGCPNESKIGELRVESPLLEGALEGGLYLAQPDDPATATPGAENPFDALIALYLVAKSPLRGILVRVAGWAEADPASGRLTVTFDDLPQLPYANFDVHFRDGQRTPLATPPVCGEHLAEISLSPWKAPEASREFVSLLRIAAGIGGGPCPSGVAPFHPGAAAGTLNRNAGSYTPFYLHLTRGDADQEIVSYSAELPPGLLGKLRGIPFCPDAAIAAAAGRGGFEELSAPSCPAASSIGHTSSGFGIGPVLAYAPGGLYLAGPYHGAPLSIVAIDAATVGPFDLGVIVVRSAIRVDTQTARVTVDSAGSDPIPHIVRGIPIHLRDVRVYIDRPGFTLNPTSCERGAVSSTMRGSGASFADAGDDTAATVSAPFQVSNCSALGFGPRFDLALRGGTRRGNYPALVARLRPRPGDANIGRAEVTLPPNVFLAQEHIAAICTRAQFAAGSCPPQSAYGSAEARTPLLGRPLRGSVYLRSNGDERPLPDLVADLRGGNGMRFEVIGRIDSVRGGIRGSFEGLPDAPVSSFTMRLAGGRHGLLVNADDLCAAPSFGRAVFVGQNNRGLRLRPRLAADCPRRARRHGRHR